MDVLLLFFRMINDKIGGQIQQQSIEKSQLKYHIGVAFDVKWTIMPQLKVSFINPLLNRTNQS